MTAIKYPITTNISPQWRVVSTSSTAMLLDRQIVYTGTHLRQVKIQGTSQNVLTELTVVYLSDYVTIRSYTFITN